VMDTLFYGPMYMGASLVDFIKGSNSTRRAVQDNQESFHQEMMMQQQVSNPTAYQIGRIGGGIVAGAAMGSAAAGSAGAFVGGTTGGANGGVLAFAGGVTAAEGGVIGGIFGAAAAIPGSPGKGDGGAGSDYYKKGRPEGGNPTEDTLVRKDTADVKSQDFNEFLEKNGETPSKWKKVMETWETPDGDLYERHYWTNGSSSYYHD